MSVKRKTQPRKSGQPLNGMGSEVAHSPGLMERYRERLGALFADLERLSTDPACNTPEFQLELQALRSRLLDLEAQVTREAAYQPQAGSTLEPPDLPMAVSSPLHSNPVLYEPDRIGFIYSQDQLKEVRSEHALGDLKPALAAPLTVGGKPIGAVELIPPAERPFVREEAEIIDTVAQQASLQIQNLRLLTETERARAEAEASTRRYIHEAWASYMDAIHQNERIGYAYDQASVLPFVEKATGKAAVSETVDIMEEQVGILTLEQNPEQPLSPAERGMVTAVASQIAQQVENIRLLSDAARARSEADQVVKRVTREGWESFTARKESERLAYVYDTNQVSPLNGELSDAPALVLPLEVRGEAIGRLAVTGKAGITIEAASMAANIATQVSSHLETIRMTEELQKQAADLLELDRLKSGFLANMSHELRTPLNSILGFADVILEELDGPLTENMTTDLKLIQKNGQHLLHLINDVLDMAKIEAGRMNLSPEEFMVNDILEEVINLTSTLASEKNLALFLEPGSEPEIQITADRTRLRQVMLNLINNAIKFTEKGKIAVHASRKDNENILLAVKDTGIGIPPDKLDVIFQEFTQVDTSSTRKVGGTGLGLPISRRLVEIHGGKLWAESTGINGEGSTFFVVLPIKAHIAQPIERTSR
jgi:signal transduction histidine kinase